MTAQATEIHVSVQHSISRQLKALYKRTSQKKMKKTNKQKTNRETKMKHFTEVQNHKKNKAKWLWLDPASWLKSFVIGT